MPEISEEKIFTHAVVKLTCGDCGHLIIMHMGSKNTWSKIPTSHYCQMKAMLREELLELSVVHGDE